MTELLPFYLAGKAVTTDDTLDVTDKFTDAVSVRISMANSAHLEQAIAAAHAAEKTMRNFRAYQRQDVLYHCVKRFKERFDELAEALCVEAGKPIRDARGEVTRLIDTFRYAGEEAVRLPQSGQLMPMDISARAADYRGMWKRVPIGACSFITPFNFPLNLVAHKVAPALAVGCPFVLKPALNTPIGSLIIGEILAETDLPPGSFSILNLRNEDADPMVEDDRFKLLSFTGSVKVGWDMKRRAGKKKITLELGGDAAVIVDETVPASAHDDAVQRIVFGAFYQSGQSCVSVQRIYLHRSIYDTLRDKLVSATSKLITGDPHDEKTFVGPVINTAAADKIERFVKQAVERGAKLLCGGTREDRLIPATLLENVPDDADLACEEVFGPVAILIPFGDFDEVLAHVNRSRYGIHAGLFTRDLYRMQHAWDELDVGGLIVGDVPSWRVDHMPYGGVKDSGLGREGIPFAIEDMTEVKFLAVRERPKTD